jgi:sensor histidine kinase YesM
LKTMSSIIKFSWSKTRKLIKRAILFASVLSFFIAIVTLFAGDTGPRMPIMFLLISGVILGFYFGNYVARIFLEQQKRTQTWLLIVLLVVSFISLFFFAAVINGFRHVTPLKVIVMILAQIFFVFPLGLFVSLLYHILKRQVAIAESSAAHSKSELQLLQSQLSPHFLFNTLNNLYGISLTEPDKTPGMLLRLSELLRYSVYDAKDEFVPLKEELKYLKNYIEFEKIRIGNRLDLKADLEDINSDTIRVAPMLLVVFVENAFKHAKNNLNEKIEIEISMKLWGNSILFSVKNSHRDASGQDSINKHSGFGLQSTIKRLELLYPNAHDLKIEKEENVFSVMLRLNVKKVSK